MLLIKICQQFLLPSVFILILILLGFIFLFLLKKKKTSKILIFIGIALYYFLSITPLADLVISPLENKYPKLEQNELQQADKIVLLLGGVESDVLRAGEALRIYFKKFPISNFQFPNAEFKIIISGTDPLNPERDEAQEVKDYLIERGIDGENVLLEDESRTTFESAQNIEKILGQEPFFLITSAYHLPRSMWVFEKNNTNPIPAPTDFKIQNEYDLLDFFPAANNLKNTDAAIHEYFGMIYYKLKMSYLDDSSINFINAL